MPYYILGTFGSFLMIFIFFYLTRNRLRNKEKIYTRMYEEAKNNLPPRWFIPFYYWLFVVFYIGSGIMVAIAGIIFLFLGFKL